MDNWVPREGLWKWAELKSIIHGEKFKHYNKTTDVEREAYEEGFKDAVKALCDTSLTKVGW